MPKRPIYRELALNPPKSEQTLQEWLFRELRSAILDGRLRPGARLPSSRCLAVGNSLSRSTVMEAFRRLKLEGYITGLVGSGSFVAENLPDEYFQPIERHLAQRSRVVTKQVPTAAAIKSVSPFPSRQRFGSAFQPSRPAVDQFPIDSWTRLISRVMRRLTPSELVIGHGSGDLGLRNEILAHFGPARHVRCDVDRIIIVNGVQQALDLLCRTLLRAGDPVWLENPGYKRARNVFQAAGATIIPAPVDQRGLQVEKAIATLPVPKLIYLTPAHQLLFPGLRLGFLVLPDHLVDPILALRNSTDRYLPVVEQKTLAEFMRTGQFGHHLRRMRELYAERWSVFSEAAENFLSDWLDVKRAECGVQTAAWLSPGISDVMVSELAAREHLEVYPISALYAPGKVRHGFLLGFGAVAPKELRSGAQRLAKLLRTSGQRTSANLSERAHDNGVGVHC
jgi:GntR family transcriptional regulator / MocR family aminotransferase